MKKVGLAVCYDTKNFGSQLQVLVTTKKIEQLGFSTEIIRYEKKLTPRFVIQSLPRLFNPYFISGKVRSRKKNRQIKEHPDIVRQVAIRNRRFDAFAQAYFTSLSIPYVGWSALTRQAAERYDIFLCGSDQLWLPSNLGSHFYTLEFAPADKPKIAYATSFGVSSVPWFQKKRTAHYLRRFQALSTRELAGKEIIEELIGRTVEVVCDPTLLFSSEEWAKLIPERSVVEGPYVLCYFLGTNEAHRKAAEALRAQTGLKLVTCPHLDHFVAYDQTFGDLPLFDVDAADFVNLIRHAEYVLTDSFHGSVFSILHHKRFLTFERFRPGANARNTRIDSLFALLGLEARRYAGDVSVVTASIDYEPVDDRLGTLRAASIDYLAAALSQGREKPHTGLAHSVRGEKNA
ncbi:MAG: polysaccharide pyruvyl transferase family protein [Clostridiales bacterium]|nr:polysaccharide pyruvyl transferase family protein [Clostridiales bacterium]